MTASGNFSAVTASNFVRIQGEDQTITPTPVEEGFISTPTFDFGKITINSSTKQYGLKKRLITMATAHVIHIYE